MLGNPFSVTFSVCNYEELSSASPLDTRSVPTNLALGRDSLYMKDDAIVLMLIHLQVIKKLLHVL